MSLWSAGDVAFIVELASNAEAPSGVGVYDTSTYDNAVYGSSEPDWVDVTEWTQQVITDRGRRTWRGRFRSGSATIRLDNQDGRFNPDAGASFPNLEVRPGTLVRVRAYAGILPYTGESIPNGTEYEDSLGNTWSAKSGNMKLTTDPELRFVLWEGEIDRVTQSFRRGGSDSEVTLTCYDFAARLSNEITPAVAAQRPNEPTASRLGYVLDLGLWTGPRELLGTLLMQATTLGRSLIAEAFAAGDAEATGLYFEEGIAKQQQRDWLLSRDRSRLIQWVAGGAESAGQPRLLNVGSWWAKSDIINDAQGQVKGGAGSPTRRVVNESRAIYGTRSFVKTDFENALQADVDAILDELLQRFAYDFERLESVTVWGQNADEAAKVFGTQIYDLLGVFGDVALRGWQFTPTAHVLGVRYSISPSDWSCTLRLDNSFRDPVFIENG